MHKFTTGSSTERRHPFTWEVLEREIAELEAALARKRTELAAALSHIQPEMEKS